MVSFLILTKNQASPTPLPMKPLFRTTLRGERPNRLKRDFLSSLIIATLFICGCASPSSRHNRDQTTGPVNVELNTTLGKVVLQLADETPLHRDNFIKLVKDGYFDGMLFHRVIQGFGIQSGDPDSKNAPPGEALGNGGPGYTIPAEINQKLFHKRGALNAARDNNPERASAGSQFFIVQGKLQTDRSLNKTETLINSWLAEHAFVNAPANQSMKDALQQAIHDDDGERIAQWTDRIRTQAEGYQDFEPYTIPETHREVYKTMGGAPHLDQNYTVFGEVIEGMDVVDAVAAQPVDERDRPVKDIRIISARIIE